MDKQAQLSQLKQKMEDDKTLPLRTAATQLVFGDGNPDAEIYFLGEAPGFYENQQGKPFVGQAGKLLERLFESIGIKREDVYISNVVRFRPPENRDPSPEEIQAFQPYVDAEIEIIKPKMIVTLGRFSMNKFLPGAYISSVHGKPQVLNWRGLPVTMIPMYHPAAALRSSDVLAAAQEDFKVIPKVLEAIKQKERQDDEEKNRPQQINLI